MRAEADIEGERVEIEQSVAIDALDAFEIGDGALGHSSFRRGECRCGETLAADR